MGLENPLLRGAAVAVVIVATVIVLWQLSRVLTAFQFIRWSRLVSVLQDFSNDLRSDGFEPSLIVGVGKGGVTIAALIGGHFSGTFVVAVRRGRRRHGKKVGIIEEDSLLQLALTTLAPKAASANVLLVTDIAHSGNTFERYREALQKMGFSQVRTFAYCIRRGISYAPDYYMVRSSRKLSFPWETFSLSSKKRRR
jgi:hypoxanthine phosphoribosyltransferase